MIDFTDRVALVTGAARGIGAESARALAEAGAKVVLVDLGERMGSLRYDSADATLLQATADRLKDAGADVVAVAADVRDVDALRRATAVATERWGRLDVVVANAGIASWPTTTWQATQEQWDEMLGVVLTGTWNTCRATIPALLAGRRGGSIVVIGSTAAVKPLPTIGHYAAAKSGLVGLVKSLALELAADSVRVNLVHPGGTGTEMTQNAAAESWQASFGGGAALELPLPIHRMEPIDIAHAVRWLASEEARYITGTELVVDAGATL